MPTWGPEKRVCHDDIYYYLKAADQQQTSWICCEDRIKKHLKLWGSSSRAFFLVGVGAQFESEIVSKFTTKWKDQGVIFSDIETIYVLIPELVKNILQR